MYHRWRKSVASAQEIIGIKKKMANNESIASAAIIRFSDQKLLIFGTTKGRILKYSYANNSCTYKYKFQESFGPNARVVIKFVHDEYLFGYVKDPNGKDKIFKTEIHECSGHRTCSTCFDGDPYCRWSVYEGRCRSDPEGTLLKERSLCPSMTSITPEIFPLGQKADVTIKYENLDKTKLKGQNLFCKWFVPSVKPSMTTATIKSADNALTCSLPVITSIAANSASVNFLVLIDEKPLLERNATITFYNCGFFKSCVSCNLPQAIKGHPYSCTWSVEKNQCNVKQSNNTVVCPLLRNSPVRIPDNRLVNITLKGKALNVINSSKFKCYVNDNEFNLVIINKNAVQCVDVKIDSTFDDGLPEKQIHFSVTSKTDGASLDSDGGRPIYAVIYKCTNFNCSYCIIRQHAEDYCYEKESKCYNGKRPLGSYPKGYCDKSPMITKISPENGPLEGGTLVTVQGHWLGLNVAALNNSVTIAGKQCTVTTVTKPLHSFECSTESVSSPLSGKIKIRNQEMNVGISFSYVNVSYPVNVTPSFCFTDFPDNFTVVIRNYNVGKSHTIKVGNITFTDIRRIVSSPETYQVKCPSNVPSVTSELVVTIDKAERKTDFPFHLLPAPVLDPKFPESKPSIESGGIKIDFPARYANYLTSATITTVGDDVVLDAASISNCSLTEEGISCPSPRGDLGKEKEIEIRTIPNVNFMRNKTFRIKFVRDPEFVLLKNEKKPFAAKRVLYLLAKKGTNLKSGASKADYKVMLNDENCEVTFLETTVLACDVSPLLKDKMKKSFIVKVQVGNRIINLGSVTFITSQEWKKGVFPLIGVVAFLAILGLVGACIYKKQRVRKQREDLRNRERYLEDVNTLAANASRMAFFEMQTAMEEMQLLETNVQLPYKSFEDFIIPVLFSNTAGTDAALAELDITTKVNLANPPTPEMIQRFRSQLLNKKTFILTLIRTFDTTTKPADKTRMAAAFSIVLGDRMEYYIEILRELFYHIVKKYVDERKYDSLQLLFRRSDLLMEKMLSNWLTICLYDHLKNSDLGTELYIVFKALTKFLYMGPVDAIENKAKNVLSEDLLLCEDIGETPIEIKASIIDEDEDNDANAVKVILLSCDAISQVKEKIIEAFYPHAPFSTRPSAEDYVLQWKRSTGSTSSKSFYIPLEAQSVMVTDRLLTIGDLNAKDVLIGSHLVLTRYDRAENMTEPPSVTSAESHDSMRLIPPKSSEKQYHLTRSDTAATTTTTTTKDFLLHHLLKTLNVVEPYIKHLFQSIFTINDEVPPPPYVEHLFSVIDRAASDVPVDKEMLKHLWKGNSYILRVWVNLLKNPEFLFDINKSPIVNASLSVVAQALMDACAYNPKPIPIKGLSTTKMVFLRNIKNYREMATQFYAKLETKNAPSDREMSAQMNSIQQSCHISEDVVYRATRFLFLKSREVTPKIIENIDHFKWFQDDDERQHFKQMVEDILGSTTSTSLV